MRYYLYLIPFIISRKTGAKFILLIASDIDVLSLYKRYKFEYKGNIGLFKYLTLSLPNDLVFNYLLKHADIVLFQHHNQQKLAGKLNNKSAIFHNILDLKNLPSVEDSSEGYYIYVGSLTLLKGSEFLLEVAKRTPTKSIVIVGQPRDAISETIFEELKKCKNVILKGWQKHDETLKLIAKAKAMINTSYFEGFPNIYLEAWALGVPVISLNVNPDNIINNYNLGIFCEGNLNQMIEYIVNGNTDSFEKASLISYVAKFHDFESTAERFTTIIDRLEPNNV
jgi:glycosyltransferase involved in cell wall biosynthesis